MDDPFIQSYDTSELEIAAEFLTNWLPFLTRDLCSPCSDGLRRRVLSLPRRPPDSVADEPPNAPKLEEPDRIEPTGFGSDPAPDLPKPRASWADMAQEDELEDADSEVAEKAEEADAEVAKKTEAVAKKADEGGVEVAKKAEEEEEEMAPGLLRDGKEMIRFGIVVRKKDFISLERVEGKIVNILDGLELHTGLFNAAEQKTIVDFVYELQRKGRNHKLGEHSYLDLQKWTQAKGPVIIQFGCCYSYSMDENEISSSILEDVAADPIPHLFKEIIRRLVQWHVLPLSCIPDSCVINIYEAGDCIPPHVDSHDFTRPFCTVSLLSQCSILFGAKLTISGDWEYAGSAAIPLPVGSVLVMNGNGANVAKHCLPASPSKRISITFRRIDEKKRPVGFNPEPDLQNIQPLSSDLEAKGSTYREWRTQPVTESRKWKKEKGSTRRQVGVRTAHDFPDSQPSQHDPDIPAERFTPRILDSRHNVTRTNTRKGKESSKLASELKKRPDLPYMQPHQIDDGRFSRSSQYTSAQGQTSEESCSLEDSKEYSGQRLVHFDKERIVVSLLEGEEDEPHITRGQSSGPAHASQIYVQSRSRGRRRAAMNFH